MFYTIGHSNRDFDQFAEVLSQAAIELLVDVRAYPRSRRNPQFDRDVLARSLAGRHIDYHFAGAALGGMRRITPDNPHAALVGDAFRAYAAHMASAEFRAELATLVEIAGHRRLALMCAERSPDDCHRSLIADYLQTNGQRVYHLIDTDNGREHRVSTALRLVGETLRYDRHAQASLEF